MNQNDTNNKQAMLSIIEKINKVEGFDPAPFAADFNDLNSGEVRKRLPVMIQMAWFRLKYPEGKISVQVTAAKDGVFIATARVYPYYKDPAEFYLAEGSASRSFMEDKPTISPREWAQTAAVGIALRNAGFGLQFAMAGEEFEGMSQYEGENASDEKKNGDKVISQSNQSFFEPVLEEPVRELTEEEKLEEALKVICPLNKYAGKTLGDVLAMDAGAIKWLATKFSGDEKIKAAALLICNHALQLSMA